jgi:excisionase family DNA binding protein
MALGSGADAADVPLRVVSYHCVLTLVTSSISPVAFWCADALSRWVKEHRGHERTRRMTQPTPPENLIDITAVAERLGVQVRHVRRLVNERRIPYIKWGHLIRFDPADFDAWIDQARRAPQRSAVTR